MTTKKEFKARKQINDFLFSDCECGHKGLMHTSYQYFKSAMSDYIGMHMVPCQIRGCQCQRFKKKTEPNLLDKIKQFFKFSQKKHT